MDVTLIPYMYTGQDFDIHSEFKACAKGMLGDRTILWKRVFFTFDSVFISFALHFPIYKKLASVLHFL